ncbi:hypothetical protein Y032_0590g383 [Ancylostoma ceylanicum]|uniref:Uncharacterized protein n=1 Tax=Ancylostoma ceylanicum TaxID=53326 RepID=A0A016WMQ9_9BILA|nr:hypothetical protein Y032_0590g383 [Ancylostoma ceylanicum]
MKALSPCVESEDECSAVGCAHVPPRNLVNGTNCTHPLCQSTRCDSVSWRVVTLKARCVRDRDPGFSAGRSSFLVFFSHL